MPQAGIAGMSEAMAPKAAMAEGGIGSVMSQPMKMAEGGLVDALFSKTDRGKDLSSKDYEIRIGKDGRRMVYKKGTNIFMGTADKLFDSKYDGGLIRANNGLPLGLRQNNPGNIRPGAGFFGETGSAGGYAQFADEDAGLRALARLLRTYGNEYDINTVRELVGRYAPESDNPDSFNNYINYLSEQLGVGADEEFDLVGRRADIIPAIVGFEQGRDYSSRYSPDQIGRAISASEFDDEDQITAALQTPTTSDTASSILSMLNPISSAQASTLTPEPVSEDTGGSFLDFLNENVLGPKGRELFGTETEAELDAKRAEAVGQRDAEEQGERARYEQDNEYFYSEEYQAYLKRAIGGGADLDISRITPDSVPSSIGGKDILSPREHMDRFATDESGESAADRFTLGMQDDTVSIMEEGADAAQEGASTEEIDEATTTRREEVAPETVVEEDDDTADDGDTTTPAAPEAPKTDDSTKTSGLSSIEEEILALQKQMKSDRDADKWLAIAQAGLAIMASDSPTLAGAIGEGGLDGLKAFVMQTKDIKKALSTSSMLVPS